MLKNKQAIKMISLIAVLALLIGIYYFVDKKKSKDKKTDTKTEESIKLIADLNSENIKKIVFKSEISKDECSYEYDKNDKKWVDTANKNWSVNNDLLNNIVKGFVDLTSTNKIEKKDDKSAYGLDKPVTTFTFFTDNKEYKGNIGSKVPTMQAYYCQIDGDDNIYTVGEEFKKIFDYSEKQLVEVESIPELDVNNIYHLLLDKKDGKDFELEYSGKKEEVSKSEKWYITKPYDDKKEGDQTVIKSFFGTFVSLKYKEFVDNNKENLSKYGLKEPAYKLCYKYCKNVEAKDTTKKDEKSDNNKVLDEEYEIYIGDSVQLDTDSDGTKEDYYYVKSAKSDDVYIISSTNIDEIIKVDIEKCVGKKDN